MNVPRLVVAWLVLAVFGTMYDFIFHGIVLGRYYQQMSHVRLDIPATWFVLSQLFVSLIFVVAYDRLYATSERRAGRGLVFGFWIGMLYSIAGTIAMFVSTRDFPFWLVWPSGLVGLVGQTLSGGIGGVLYAKKSPSVRAAVAR